MMCMCRWKTDWHERAPSLITSRYELTPSAATIAGTATASICPRIALCSALANCSCVKPLRTFGMTRTCVGATGAISRKASTSSSSYTTSAGISLAMILSKIVLSAESTRPAPRMVSHLPRSSHLARVFMISPKTRMPTASTSVMCPHHRVKRGPIQSVVSKPNLGSMCIQKTAVGKTAQSAAVGCAPSRYGPFASTKVSSSESCLIRSSIASLREPKRPKGGEKNCVGCL
mmetsp:Transcript_466/g.893  ORF Transcript_466/g.893 Transcript_466/m.893 type:complete len:231 (-) Transcript_466:501-1193(-)